METTKKTTTKKGNDKPEKKLSKVGEWLRSDNPPLWDISGLSDKEHKYLMRLILK